MSRMPCFDKHKLGDPSVFSIDYYIQHLRHVKSATPSILHIPALFTPDWRELK